MAGQLSTEQVLLLNNLMYMKEEGPFPAVVNHPGESVGNLLGQIDVNAIDPNKDYGSFITGKDWINIINAVKNDPELSSYQIASTNVDHAEGGGGGGSALFVNPDTNEAVVAFRGTAGGEWKDNFIGGGPTDMPDGVSTQQQQNALEWYQSLNPDQYSNVTVTGHSKGGNKAKYITVKDDSVDQCISFDGQGFSDEFMEKYKDEISMRQDKISNNNVESDYVNLLLNDIGDTTYYEGHDYGKGKFLENHSPNTFFQFHKDGSFSLNEGTRDPRMAQVDEFLNSYLRSLPADKKREALNMVGELVETGFSNDPDMMNSLLDILLEGNNVDNVGYLAAYLVEYIDKNPGFQDVINGVLKDMELDDITKIVDVVVNITQWKYFDELVDVVSWGSDKIPNLLYDLLRKWLAEKGIELSNDDLRKFMSVFQSLDRSLDKVNVNQNGSDHAVNTGAGKAIFQVSLSALEKAGEDLAEIKRQMEDCMQSVDRLAGQTRLKAFSMLIVRQRLELVENRLEVEGKKCLKLKKSLGEIHEEYRKTETGLVEQF
ncbi:MAG: DUF2974 domain-containing protein [Lachnospiraceae bacterium]|nr:DUF2974 domain-containing protein [Lachnospiraceae bacterium]